jgi:hypothetical protein
MMLTYSGLSPRNECEAPLNSSRSHRIDSGSGRCLAPQQSDHLAALRQTHLFGSLAAITSRCSMDGGWVNISPACASASALAAR